MMARLVTCGHSECSYTLCSMVSSPSMIATLRSYSRRSKQQITSFRSKLSSTYHLFDYSNI